MPSAHHILTGAKDRGNRDRGTFGKSASGLDEAHRANGIAPARGAFDRKNCVRKLVRGLPVKRDSYNEFVQWLQSYKS